MARQYESTHRHISVRANLSTCSPTLWIALGECQSKCEHVARTPLRPDTASALNAVYLAKGVLATTAIEGNTLSEEEVLRHIGGSLSLPPSRQYLADEIDRILAGCQRIAAESVQGPTAPLTVAQIMQLNLEVLGGLAVDPDVVPGRIREHSVTVGRYRAAPAEDCEYLLDRLCGWLNGPDFIAAVADQETVFALIKAIIAHLYVAWIHPFGDGNGRTARMLEFLILTRSGVPAISAHLLSDHYNRTRSVYYRELDRASRTGEVVPFIHYAVQGFRDGLREQLDKVWEQQHDITWRSYVHEFFRDKEHTPAGIRRRQLALDLSRHPLPVRREDLPGVSARMAAAYATIGPRTVDRDVSFLVSSGLVVRSAAGLEANKGIIHGFVSPRAVTNRSAAAEYPHPAVG